MVAVSLGGLCGFSNSDLSFIGSQQAPLIGGGRALLECHLFNHHLGTLWARLLNNLTGGFIYGLRRANLYPAFQKIHIVSFERPLLSFKALQRHLSSINVKALPWQDDRRTQTFSGRTYLHCNASSN